jgi:hypothetical protein
MKRLGVDLALLRILLVAVPFGCGPQTFYEPAPTARCGTSRFVPYSWSLLSRDGGTGGSPDAGASADGGMMPDGGTSVGDGGTGSFLASTDCAQICGDTMNCQLAVDPTGNQGVDCLTRCYTVGCGRRPESLAVCAKGSPNPVARYFEEAAYLEAASVFAFERMAVELAAHQAPPELIQDALLAVAEEIRHTRVMSSLARRFGGVVQQPQPGPRHIRSLLEIAIENVQEGCVRETYGALLACLQSVSASDAQVRHALRVIAREETAHARLAFAVAEFCHDRLTPEERELVAQAERRAVSELQEAVDIEVPFLLCSTVGLPPRDVAQRLIAEATQLLWTA